MFAKVLEIKNTPLKNNWYQKQPPQVFCKKTCSQKFREIDRKAPVSESLY